MYLGFHIELIVTGIVPTDVHHLGDLAPMADALQVYDDVNGQGDCFANARVRQTDVRHQDAVRQTSACSAEFAWMVLRLPL